MSKILVSIFYENSEGKSKGVKVALPGQLSCEEIISSLVKKLALKAVDENGEKLNYSLCFKSSQQALSNGKTLAENEVRENDLLTLQIDAVSKGTQFISQEPEEAVETAEDAENTEENGQDEDLEMVGEAEKPDENENLQENEENEDFVQVLRKKRCPLCNEEVSEMEAFCHNCGQRLISRNAEPKTAQNESEKINSESKHSSENKGNSKITLVIAVLCAIIIIISGILIVLYTRNNAPIKTEKNDIVTDIPTDPFDGSQQTTLAGESQMIVEVTIPKDLQTDDEYSEILTKDQQDRGFISVKKNADGSITYSIRKDAWRMVLTDLKKDVVKIINETNNDESFPSIERITYNTDFSNITFEVNRQVYENSMDSFAGMSVYFAVVYYRLFSQLDQNCTITVIDSITKETIDVMNYPEAL